MTQGRVDNLLCSTVLESDPVHCWIIHMAILQNSRSSRASPLISHHAYCSYTQHCYHRRNFTVNAAVVQIDANDFWPSAAGQLSPFCQKVLAGMHAGFMK